MLSSGLVFFFFFFEGVGELIKTKDHSLMAVKVVVHCV